MKRKITILGSTGSIGTSTLQVIEAQMDTFEVFGLACKGNIELLNRQIDRFKPTFVCVDDASSKEKVAFDSQRLLTGAEGLKEMIGLGGEIIVNALPGSTGLEPTIEAIRLKKTLALANKEGLVMAGRIISRLIRQTGARLIPVDSEHSALYQLLKGVKRDKVKSITITASGGPFREYKRQTLEMVRPEEAINHPTWKMGKKVSLDSATLMNKGLEVIEARWLFDIDSRRIQVLIHPESIVHGMVEFIDNSTIVYMASPDMRLPISYAINEGEIREMPVRQLRLEELTRLTFYAPDIERFPSLRLALEALDAGDSASIVLNAANEVASEAFLEGRIRFTEIPLYIEKALDHHIRLPVIERIEDVWETHRWAKEFTLSLIKQAD